MLTMMKYQLFSVVSFFSNIFVDILSLLACLFSGKEAVSQVLVISPSFDLSLFQLLSYTLCSLAVSHVQDCAFTSGFLHNSKEPASKSTAAEATRECAECTVLLLCGVTRRGNSFSMQLMNSYYCFLWREKDRLLNSIEGVTFCFSL